MTRDKKSIDSTQEDILETIDVGGNGVDEFDVECMEGICSGGESSNPRAGDKELVEKLRLKVEDKMKELLNEEEQKYLELVGNVRLLRFLLAYKRDLEQAATAYEAFLNWYSENKIGDIRRDIVKNHITFDNIPLGDKVMTYYPVSLYHNEDNQGHIVGIEMTGSINTQFFLEHYVPEEFQKWLHYQLEVRAQELDKRSREQKKFFKVTQLRCFKGIGLQHTQKEVLDIAKLGIKTSTENYPETLNMMIGINIPKFFNLLWRIAKPWFNEQMIDKFKFFASTGYQELLFSKMETQRVPTFFGGLCVCKPLGCVHNFSPIENKGTTISISAGSSYSLPLPVVEENLKIRWKFSVQSYDIKCMIYFKPQDSEEEAQEILTGNHDSKKEHQGSYISKSQGVVTFHWDNTYSRFRGKSVTYKIDVGE